MNKNLGRLEKVELREIWEKEDMHFTPWLAQEQNIECEKCVYMESYNSIL